MRIVAACHSRTAMKFAMLGITVFSRNHCVSATDNPPNNSIVRTLLLDVVSTIECLSIIVLSQSFCLAMTYASLNPWLYSFPWLNYKRVELPCPKTCSLSNINDFNLIHADKIPMSITKAFICLNIPKLLLLVTK